MAAMQGLALVTGRPVVGVSALDALALTAFEQLGGPRARVGAGWTPRAARCSPPLYDVARSRTGGPTLTALTHRKWACRPPSSSRGWHGARPRRPSVMAGDARASAIADRLTRRRAGAAAAARWRRPSRAWGAALAQATGPHLPHHLQPLYVRRPDVEIAPGGGPCDAVTDFPRSSRSPVRADLDGVLAIEDASFNNPTTRDWYEAELQRPDVC